MVPDLAESRPLRRAGADRRHFQRHSTGDGHRRPFRLRHGDLRLGILRAAHKGNAQDRHRTAGGDPFGGLGLHRADGNEFADHRVIQRAHRPERAQRRRHSGADERADHRLDRRGRAKGRARLVPRSRPRARRDQVADGSPRVAAGRQERLARGYATRRGPGRRGGDGGADGDRTLDQNSDRPARPRQNLDRDHRSRVGRGRGRLRSLSSPLHHRHSAVFDHLRRQPGRGSDRARHSRQGMSAVIESPPPTAAAPQFTKTDFVRKNERRELVARFIFAIMALLMILPLALIVSYLFIRALPVLSFDFLFKVPVRGMRAGGVWPALLGTIYLVLISLAAATPVGVLAAVYLNEYARENWFTRVVNLAVVNLAGVPSIVHALFGL